MEIQQLIILGATAFTGIIAGYMFGRKRESHKKHSLQLKAGRLMNEVKKEAEKLEQEANDEAIKIRMKLSGLDEDFSKTEKCIQERIKIKEEGLSKRELKSKQKEDQYNSIKANLEEIESKNENAEEELLASLLKKTNLKREELKEKITNQLEKDFKSYFKQQEVQIEERAKEKSSKESVKILQSVMQRYVGQSSSNSSLERLVKIPKGMAIGRILGKGGKNLAYFEEKSEVHLVIDDQPGYITVSYYNLVKQETARIALSKLVREKEINEKVIDAALEDARKEMDEILYKDGVRAAKLIGIEKTDRELMILIGRMKYRTSYGQNILYHSIEIAFFCEMLAAAIGADTHVAKLAGFYHDIGKAIDQDVNEPHDYLSKQILEKFDYPWEIVHAAWTHHDAEPPETVEAQLVKAADALSGGRPGARTESAESYYERVQALEGLALEAEGVKKAYAVSGAREIRAFVDEDEIGDATMQEVAEGLADEIEENVTYPGKIKVNLIRILNAIEYANKK